MTNTFPRLAQGEITIIRVESFPENVERKPAEKHSLGHIISHSEKGNHHVLTGTDVQVVERTSGVPAGMRILEAILEDPQQLIQDAAGNPHGKHDLPPGLYEFRIAREIDPWTEQIRQVAD